MRKLEKKVILSIFATSIVSAIVTVFIAIAFNEGVSHGELFRWHYIPELIAIFSVGVLTGIYCAKTKRLWVGFVGGLFLTAIGFTTFIGSGIYYPAVLTIAMFIGVFEIGVACGFLIFRGGHI
jgi:hypothetical protein